MKKRTPELVAQAKQLKQNGLSNREIGRQLGASHETVNAWIDPSYATRRRQKDRQRNKQSARKQDIRRRSQVWEDSHKHETLTYFLESGGLIKIGSTNNVARRMYHIAGQSPLPINLLGTCLADEKDLHDLFASFRHHGEWFIPSPEIMEYIEANCAKT